MSDEFRRILSVFALSIAIFLGFNYFFPQKTEEVSQAQSSSVRQSEGAQALSRDEAIALSKDRLTIENNRVNGNINLKAAVFDNLTLSSYKESLDSDNPVTLLSPRETSVESWQFSVEFYSTDKDLSLPNKDTIWQANGDSLTPTTPVTLSWDNGQGVIFKQRWSVDENYMFLVEQFVENNSGKEVPIFTSMQNIRSFEEANNARIVHTGAVGALNDSLELLKYKKISEETEKSSSMTIKDVSGWFGFTEQYWMVLIAPDKDFRGDIVLRSKNNDTYAKDTWQMDWVSPLSSVQAGENQLVNKSHFYAGSKRYDIVAETKKTYDLKLFEKSIDFGWYYFITRPFLILLTWLNSYLGNMGLAIMAMTVIVKIVLLPLAIKSYKSMARMKLLQPKMEKLKEEYGEDKNALNQAMMELYKKEKVNPAAGCLPIFLQIPIFYSLYKVLNISIEMRQAPFFGWIKDLSMPDPTSILNLFGLLPYSGNPADWGLPFLSIIALGAWPIFMGISMYLQQALNPAPTDKTQAMVFKFLPIIFTFMLGSFASGLVIYWTWNNILSFAQQWFITRKVVKDVAEKKPLNKKLNKKATSNA